MSCRQIIKTVRKKVRGKTRKVKVRRVLCTKRTVSGTVTLTTTGANQGATVSRARATYATGIAVPTGPSRWQLVLNQRRPLHSGHYTLTLRRHRGHRTTTQWMQIRLS